MKNNYYQKDEQSDSRRFAEELGVSRQAVSKWENGTSIPDVQLLLRIADFYNLTLDQLVRDDFDLPISSLEEKKIAGDLSDKSSISIDDYLGKYVMFL